MLLDSDQRWDGAALGPGQQKSMGQQHFLAASGCGGNGGNCPQMAASLVTPFSYALPVILQSRTLFFIFLWNEVSFLY